AVAEGPRILALGDAGAVADAQGRPADCPRGRLGAGNRDAPQRRIRRRNRRQRAAREVRPEIVRQTCRCTWVPGLSGRTRGVGQFALAHARRVALLGAELRARRAVVERRERRRRRQPATAADQCTGEPGEEEKSLHVWSFPFVARSALGARSTRVYEQ